MREKNIPIVYEKFENIRNTEESAVTFITNGEVLHSGSNNEKDINKM